MVPRADRPARIQTMLRLGDLVGYPRQLAGQLSGGYRQRLALTRALVHGPRLVFLDEPPAGVDPVSPRTVWAVVPRPAHAGPPRLLTTPYQGGAGVCDTPALTHQGRAIGPGRPAGGQAQH